LAVDQGLKLMFSLLTVSLQKLVMIFPISVDS